MDFAFSRAAKPGDRGLLRCAQRHPDGIEALDRMPAGDGPDLGRIIDTGQVQDDPEAFARLCGRLFDRVEVDGESGCWIKRGSEDSGGYAQVRFPHALENNVARIVCAMVHGPMCRRLFARHSKGCVSRACINPSHLIPGDHEHNTADGKQAKRAESANRLRRVARYWVPRMRAKGVADVRDMPRSNRLSEAAVEVINAAYAAETI